jgi:hypothetical protein
MNKANPVAFNDTERVMRFLLQQKETFGKTYDIKKYSVVFYTDGD